MGSFMELLRQNKYSYHYDDPQCFSKIEKTIYSFLLDCNQDFSKELVYLCIGTDRATGDCLGPLVGTRLKGLLASAHIYGTLEQPVHATNLNEFLADIEDKFKSPLLVAVDACLGNSDRIGFINVGRGSLRPGTALKKALPEVGDFHVSGVVNVGGFLEHMVLQNTRLHTVYRMSEIIAQGLCLAHYNFIRNRPHLLPNELARD